jgi:hypothetical protein
MTTLPVMHSAARLCKATPEQAWRHLCGAAGMARWCLGMFETREIEPGLMSGRSLFSGATVYARLVCDEAQRRVDYSVGSAPDALMSWIHAQVTPGGQLGYGSDQCLVALWACRPQAMSDASWQRVMRTHETEIDLIAQQIEADGSAGRG